jgi:MFS family permease
MRRVQRRVIVAADAAAVREALLAILPDAAPDTVAGAPPAPTTAAGQAAAGEWVVHSRSAALPAGDETLTVAARPAPGGGIEVTAESHLRLRLPFFTGIVRLLLRVAQRRHLDHLLASVAADATGAPPPPRPRAVPGLPHVRFEQPQAALLASAAMAAAVAGFGAALFGQHADFIADSFDSSDASLGVALAVTRVGVIVSLVATAAADRRGRRLLLLVAISGVALANLATAAAPNLATFTAFQTVTRGFVNAAFAVAGVAALEEAPEGARAFAAAMIAMAAGLGFSIAVVTLPLSDAGDDAWRASFVLSGLSLLLVPRIGRALVESRRYTHVAAAGIRRGDVRALLGHGMRQRFVMLAVLGFAGNLFGAPSAQLMNRYLADEHGFSGAGIAGFRAATTALPGLVGLLVAMRLVELRGRRPVGGVGTAVGHAVQIVFFLASGATLWVASGGSVLFSAAGGIALGALAGELFPTEIRATSSAVLTVVAVVGSATGLVLAGALSDPLGGIGTAIAWLGVPALLAVVLIVPRLPEPAGRALDDVSPPSLPPGA